MKKQVIVTTLLLIVPISGYARNTNWLEQDTLTGNWGGYRQQLTESGVTFEAVYTADYFSNRHGGERVGGAFLDNTDIIELLFYLHKNARNTCNPTQNPTRSFIFSRSPLHRIKTR